MCYHFNRQNWGDRIRILEYHSNPLPIYEKYGSQVPVGRLNKRHYMPEKCKQGEDRCLRRDNLKRCFEAIRVLFHINAKTIPPSEALPYLGRTITYNKSDWSAVYLNMRKARKRWGMMARVL